MELESRDRWENLFLVVLVLLSLLGFAWTLTAPISRRDMATALGPDLPSPRLEVIRIALPVGDDPAESDARSRVLAAYLSLETPFHVEALSGENDEALLQSLESGVADVALLGPSAFVEARRRIGAVALVQVQSPAHTPFHRANIVVRETSPVRSLRDLRGLGFAFAGRKSTSGNLIPRVLLDHAGVCLRDLRETRNFSRHGEVARAVLRGEFEGGSLRDTVAKGFLGRGLRVLAESMPVPNAVICVRPDARPDLVDALRRSLLQLDPGHPEDRRLLKRLDPELRHGFREARPSDFHAVEDLLDRIPTGCGAGCHPAEEKR